MTTPLLSVRDVCVEFPLYKRKGFRNVKHILKAVNNISFDLSRGETLGIVGESGCGKSTLARAILGLNKPVSGSIKLHGEELIGLASHEFQEKRRHMQVIFQDPLASLNPRMTIGEIIAEPLQTFYPELSKQEIKARVKSIMDKVGLLPNQINRYPHEFSGGQCQRIGIARALIIEPEIIVCDEPVSALDVSIQAQIINLLMELQKELGLALIFIAHDLSVVKHISDRILVAYLGKAMEISDRDSLYHSPMHPYTRALITAVPIPDPREEKNKQVMILSGDLPSPINPPSGCVFRTRCPDATTECENSEPQLRSFGNNYVACHHYIQEQE